MTRPLSIAMVCYPGLGGSGVVASELAAGLAARGHCVHVLASAPPSRPLPESDRLFFHEVAVSDAPLYEHPPYAMAVASTIVDVAADHPLDLVHTHYAVPHATSAWMASQVLGAASPRIVHTLHGTDITRPASGPGYRAITRHAVTRADGLSVPSQFLAAEARRVLDLGADTTIDVLANFIDTDHFAPAPQRDRGRLDELFASAGLPRGDGPVLFHVSNFRPLKRVADVIEVLALVRRHLPARLVLVGDGPERALAAARARELGVAASACFAGKRTDFADLLRHADAFVLPSETESFGVAAAEALGSGVPVFAYRVGGLPEVVPESGGVLVEACNVEALADAVTGVLVDQGRHAAMALAARAHAEQHFARRPAIDRYEAFYRRVLGAAARQGAA